MTWQKPIVLALISTLIFCSCQTKDKYEDTIHERICDNFADIKSYKASCAITVHAKGDRVYNAKIKYEKSTETLTLSYDDISVTVSGEWAVITKDGVALKSKSADSYMPIFVNTFFKYYYGGEESFMNVSKLKNFAATVLETELAGKDKNAARQKLWIDNETALPLKTEILNSDGGIYMEIVYKSFKFTKE